MNRPGLRTTLLAPLFLTLAVGSAGLAFFVQATVARDLIGGIDDELTRALLVDRAGQGVTPGPVGGPGRPPGQPDGRAGDATPTADLGNDMGAQADADGAADAAAEAPQQIVLDGAGNVVDVANGSDDLAGRALGGLAAGDRGPVTLDGDPRLRAGSLPGPDGTTTVVALSMADVDRSLSSLRRNLFGGVAALLAAQAALVVLVVRSVNRPITRLSRAAHRIAGGDLQAEVGPASGPAEVKALTDDLAAMVARLRSTIDERERAADQAERARADMERFMADASHELRTPLTALQGFSDLHAGGMLDAEGVDTAMSRIGTESRRLTALVNDLLRLLSPTDARSIEPVDLAAVASAVAQDLRVAYPDHPLSLDLGRGVDGGAGAAACVVIGDPARLHQAALNLGANACQHTPAGTPVSIEVSRRNGLAVLEVVDRGPGIDAPTAESLFEPFVRGDRSRSRHRHDGAGLGLTITRRIVDQHGGTVTFSPTSGGGTTTTIALPAVDGGT
ncbi:MAG: HAMP domain-containing sensor histidine kinase [Actinomycetota bacterium]